jgi:hypothetical protein
MIIIFINIGLYVKAYLNKTAPPFLKALVKVTDEVALELASLMLTVAGIVNF